MKCCGGTGSTQAAVAILIEDFRPRHLLTLSVFEEAEPGCHRSTVVFQRVEGIPVRTPLFYRSNRALDDAVVVEAVRCDDLLMQAIATNQGRKLAVVEHKVVVRSRNERLWLVAQCSESSD